MLDTYSGATRVIFIVGSPIEQVKSPQGVTRALRARGRDAVVVPAHVEPADLADFFSIAARMPNVDGILVTVPHKFAALRACESATDRARSIGAVNVARRRAGGGTGWHGDMCDGAGHVQGLRNAGFEPRGARVLLVGAGGAGSAIAHALVEATLAALSIVDPDAVRREALSAKLRGHGEVVPQAGSTDPRGFDLVVNASPLGMRVHDPLPIDVDLLEASCFVSDVVTVPEVPPLIARARERGCRTMTGTAMFEAVRDEIVAFYR
ncbi:MAG: shikimate dehydrogenase [Lautropia sp.]